jgi:radical SAM protein with 4Fe4S-binding SPASM domain
MCPVQYRGTSGAFMRWELFTAIVDQLPTVRELHLQGLGEPFLHPRFFDMTRYAAGKGMRVSVNTNLTVLPQSHADRLASSGIDTMFVSVDGALASTYERIRVGARFDRLERNLARLAGAARRNERPLVELTAVVMRENLTEISGLVRLAARHAIGTMHVQHLCHDFAESTLPGRYAPMRSFIAEQTLLEADSLLVADAFTDAAATARQLGITLRLPPVAPRVHAPGVPGRERCDWPWRGPYITYDGTAMPCCVAATPDRAELGSVVRDGIEAVWNGAAYTAFRNRLDGDDAPEICRSCSIYRRMF